MPIHKDQRVGIFVDVQNLYYSAKQFYNSKVNFAQILSKAVSGRQLIRAIAYVIKADIKEEHNFFEALEKIGYEVKSKDLQVFMGGAKKGDWDIGIAMDIMKMSSKLDVIIVVSGDGDFRDLIEHVKALGCRAEVLAFKKTASARLIEVCDDFIDLDKDLDKYLIKTVRPENGKKDAILEQNKDLERDMQGEAPKTAGNGKPEPKKTESKPVPKPQERGNRPQRPGPARKDFKRERGPEKSFNKDRQNTRGYGSGPRQGGFQGGFDSSREMSLIQRLNMEQPDLDKIKDQKTSPQPAGQAQNAPKADDKVMKKAEDSKKPEQKKPAQKRRGKSSSTPRQSSGNPKKESQSTPENKKENQEKNQPKKGGDEKSIPPADKKPAPRKKSVLEKVFSKVKKDK